MKRNPTETKLNESRSDEYSFKTMFMNKFRNKDEKTLPSLSDSGYFSTTTLTTEEHAKPIFVKKPITRNHKSENDLKKLLFKPFYIKKEEADHSKSQRSFTEKGKGGMIHVLEDGKDVMVMRIMSGDKVQVIAGTLDRLFMKLADETNQDPDYIDTFILFHSHFTTSFELFDKLMTRFHSENSHKIGQRSIQFNDLCRIHYTLETGRIRQMIEEQPLCLKEPRFMTTDDPKHDLVRRLVTLDPDFISDDLFLSMDTRDIAKCLTLADFDLLKSIRIQDYLNYEKEDDYVKWIIERVNKTSEWVMDKVSRQITMRRAIVYKMIDIAKICLDWNNFHTSMMIIMTLHQEDVQNHINYKKLAKYLNVNNNMNHYRAALKKAKPPCVPFFPLILKDLTFLLDGNSTVYQGQSHLINFNKFRLVRQTIENTIHFTSQHYTI
ncbi:hypothetical protein G6F52_011831 [Rhizopus delemar]|nr:hypothetical protein G6F52_011831 [Rhizopus delemar]